MAGFATTASERATMSRGLGFLFGAGGLLVFLSLALPHSGDIRPWGPGVAATLALVVSTWLLLRPERAGPRGLSALLAIGTLLITVCVVSGGNSATAYVLMYVWVALYGFYFFAHAWAVGHLVFAAACFAGALALQDTVSDPYVHWVMAVGTVVVAGVLIGTLTRAIRSQATDLAAVARMAGGPPDPTGHVQATCDELRRSTGADVAVMLEPDAERTGLAVSAMAGSPGAGHRLATDGARAALQRVFHEGAAEVISAQDSGPLARLSSTACGFAQRVSREGEPAGVLAVGWARPRRRGIPDRIRSSVLLFAAETGVALERSARASRESERRALEINDEIVQGLVVAKYAIESGRSETGTRVIDETLERARRLMTEQLDGVLAGGGEIRPGDLARDTGPANPLDPAGT